ncbi:hypothetical protein HanIR_Chr02g0058811 [Helianthus annuus]|nr:hypothetical protein HanIR_Chr02g0058811 [Helianthus annuus]
MGDGYCKSLKKIKKVYDLKGFVQHRHNNRRVEEKVTWQNTMWVAYKERIFMNKWQAFYSWPQELHQLLLHHAIELTLLNTHQ